ncbi:MAG: hypothetical protein HY810_07685 [Candidatus Omnitrophica bacterium]|nr:hypothetical protein [Candidatus Omnitrophota bacterium]
MLSFTILFLYALIVIYLMGSPIFLTDDICKNWKNILFEVLHIIFFLTLPILYFYKGINIGKFLLILFIGIIILDLCETLVIALTGSYGLFKNKGSTLRERKVAFLLNIFSLGKPVKTVRFGHIGSSMCAFVDFFDDRTADGRDISDKLPSLFQALEIRSNIISLMKL